MRQMFGILLTGLLLVVLACPLIAISSAARI
jgi:hypothetical protein